MKNRIATLGLLALAACGQSVGAPVERLAMDRLEASPGINAAPDAIGATWTRLDDGRSLSFGKPGRIPLLSIACRTEGNAGAQMQVIRYAPADPGAKAMLALIGNGRVLRVKADAIRRADGWRWEGVVPARDIHLEVFAGHGSIEATLPGGGTFKTAASGEPAQLFQACRALARQEPAVAQASSARRAPAAG